MTQLLPPKKEVALALLERSNVDVYLDPRARGVVVPPQFRKEPRLILKIGLNMPVPIPDLRLDEESMSCTLSFNRSPFYCVVPWSSVFAMVGEDGRGMVWPDDVPQELAVKVVDNEEGGGPTSPRAEGGSAAGARRGPRKMALADEPAPSSSDANGKKAGGKRKKVGKKEEPTRPVLVAVPPPPASEPAPEPALEPAPEVSKAAASAGPASPAGQAASSPSAAAAGASSPGSAGPAGREGGSPAAPPKPQPGSGRPKRELPPYLRVVK